MFCPALRSYLFISLICVLLAEMDSAFNADRPDDDLSTAFGAETLAEGDMVPEGFANTPTSRTDMAVEVIGGGRYLRVDPTEIGGHKNTKGRRARDPRFSSAKKLINPERNALGDAPIEASECLKALVGPR